MKADLLFGGDRRHDMSLYSDCAMAEGIHTHLSDGFNGPCVSCGAVSRWVVPVPGPVYQPDIPDQLKYKEAVEAREAIALLKEEGWLTELGQNDEG